MENNISKEQALHLIKSWGDEFWKRIPSRCVKSVLGLYSLSDAAKEFGVTPQAFCHYADDGRIPRPTLAFNKARYYTAAEVRKMRMFFNERLKGGQKPQRGDVAEMRAKWLEGVSQVVIAEQHGLSQGSVSRLVRGQR